MQDTQHATPHAEQFTLEARPLAALTAGVKFLTNIQETSNFFRVTDAIDGRQNEENYQRFIRTPIGAQLDKDGVRFAEVLDDHDALAAMPAGSLGRAYLHFLTSEDLEMDMLMSAERDAESTTLGLDKSRRIFMENGLALHDVLHVMTGYGRDAVGEACLLAFTAEQFSLKGVGLVGYGLAMREQARRLGAPILSAYREAKQLGRAAVWIPEIDWRAYLDLPLETARAAMRLTPPEVYLSIENLGAPAAAWVDAVEPPYRELNAA